MAANKYISLVAGKLKEIFGQVTSSGVGDADKIVALDATGKIDISLLPPGVGAEVVVAISSENLGAGDFVISTLMVEYRLYVRQMLPILLSLLMVLLSLDLLLLHQIQCTF